MRNASVFCRVEKKYLITRDQALGLWQRISAHLVPDPFGPSTVCSGYLDTPSFQLIRQSMENTAFKEKLRLRSYGLPGPEDRVFLEIKRKCRGVVYKRRQAMSLSQARAFLEEQRPPRDSQILQEIGYFFSRYGPLSPALTLFYQRRAFDGVKEPGLRLTFDSRVRYTPCPLWDCQDTQGQLILGEDRVLLEIKTLGAMPLWLSHSLDACRIYPSKFSKYGTAYGQACQKGELLYAGSVLERISTRP